jgi:L-asparaginase
MSSTKLKKENHAGRILVAAMGGTIVSRAGADGLHAPTLSVSDVVHTAVGTATNDDIDVLDVAKVQSPAIRPEHMLQLAMAVNAAVEDGYAGVVVTHGTDTLEETAYALALMLPPLVPVVVTGSMRSADQPGADGPANLRSALTAARDQRLGSFGPLVAFQDELHMARWATKAHTSGVAAFASPGLGPVAWISEDEVHLVAGNPPWDEYLGQPPRLNAKVELIEVVAGMDGDLLEAAAGWADGIVLAGTGGGHVPPSMVDGISRAIDSGVAVVIASRTGAGPVLRDTYGGPGSEADLRQRGVISAGTLQPRKARMRLMVALSMGLEATSSFQ